MSTDSAAPQQALKDRVASEVRDYERGRDIYAHRKFYDYEKATQGEKKIMSMVGQAEKRIALPRPGEWVVQAPLKVKAGRKWNASKSLNSLRKSLDGSGESSRRAQPRPFPGSQRASVDGSVSFGDVDAEIVAGDFRSQSGGLGDISRLQSDNVLQRRSASATPALVPLSMPGERGMTMALLNPEEDQVFATTSLRDISRSRRRCTSVDNAGGMGAAPLPSSAFARMASDMPKMDALQQGVDAEASRVFDGADLDLGPEPADDTIPDPHAAQSPVRRGVARVQSSVVAGATPSF